MSTPSRKRPVVKKTPARRPAAAKKTPTRRTPATAARKPSTRKRAAPAKRKPVPLTAKEAVYSYTSFRSQLEARWAVFFDVMGWDWDYEPSHYPVTDTLGYMPDFYLPRFGLWAEGKGSRYLDMASMRKCVNAVGGSRPLPLREPPYWPNNGLLMLGPVIELDKAGGHPVHTLLLTTQVGHTGAWRAVWAYSAKRAARDNKTLTAQENRAKAVIAGEKAARTPRFVKTTNGTRRLDEGSLQRARKLVGLKGYVSNISATIMPAGEVIASYHDLWHVEQSFRMSKTDLSARPMFARTRDAIEAHLTIVFAALALSREAQARTGLSTRNLTRQLRTLRSATIAINGATQTFAPAIPADKQALLQALHGPKLTH